MMIRVTFRGNCFLFSWLSPFRPPALKACFVLCCLWGSGGDGERTTRGRGTPIFSTFHDQRSRLLWVSRTIGTVGTIKTRTCDPVKPGVPVFHSCYRQSPPPKFLGCSLNPQDLRGDHIWRQGPSRGDSVTGSAWWGVGGSPHLIWPASQEEFRHRKRHQPGGSLGKNLGRILG